MNIIKNAYVIVGVVLSSAFIHELFHAIETGFQITEFCSIGWTKGMTSIGWIRTNEPVNEILAYSIQFIYVILVSYLCWRKK